MSAKSKMYELLEFLNEINNISSKLPNIGPVFNHVSLSLPKLDPSELGFIRVVSWLYVQYYEAGKLRSELLTRTFSVYQLDESGERADHRIRIQKLRTYTQHNLSPSESHSKNIESACEEWFRVSCGTNVPGTEEHWQKLLFAIIEDAKKYLECLRDALRHVEQDESKEQLLQQWTLRINQYHAPYEFDRIISIVTTDLGRDAIDVVKFRKRYYDKWRKEFEVRTDDCDFENEARKLIEHALLSEQQNILPLNGKDIMNIFHIAPGPKLAEVLNLARDLFTIQPCSKNELITKLKEKLNFQPCEAIIANA